MEPTLNNQTSPPLAQHISVTPVSDALEAEHDRLNKLSAYKSSFDWSPFQGLEKRFADKTIRGGFVFKSPFKQVNAHPTCQQCLYTFELDTYGRGCVHNCVYCYAKAELTVHGFWNRPIPFPVDINAIRKIFYNVFETDKKSKWRSTMMRRVPIRIGSMSDSFMWMDQKFKVTQELLKILDFYQYPYIIFTRSDLVARDDYASLLNKNLCSVQFSMSSTNETLNKKIEPGAPSAKRRLLALEKLNNLGFWTTVRINPFFPMYPDGYFTDPNFDWVGDVPKFDYSSFEMIDEIADAGVPSILTGFGRFSSYSLNQIEKASGFDIRTLFNHDSKKTARDYHFSDKETRYYYEKMKAMCDKRKVDFSTCYIGNGENHFWKDQDLWSNKKDCCNAKGKVSTFKEDSRSIPFEERIKFSAKKDILPVNSETLHKPLGGEVLEKR